ncbi:MAG: hypothetical protein HY608_08730 [Planctomycetes bacterium]|nr:hypothetical protein [Planctomycetota bacterium]
MATTTGERRPAQKAEAPIVRPDVTRKGVGLLVGCLIFYGLLVTGLLVFFNQDNRIRTPGDGGAANVVEEDGNVFEVAGDVVEVPKIQQGFLGLRGDVEHRAELTVSLEVRIKPGSQVSDTAEVERVRRALPRLQDLIQNILNDPRFNFAALFDPASKEDLKNSIMTRANQQIGGVVAAVYINIVPEW